MLCLFRVSLLSAYRTAVYWLGQSGAGAETGAAWIIIHAVPGALERCPTQVGSAGGIVVDVLAYRLHL